MEIQNVCIKNIKGFDDTERLIPLDLKSKRVNLLIAPNGWGKSSLVAAFKAIQPGGLKVIKSLKNRNHVDDSSSITVTIDGHLYVVDESHNELSDIISCQVINCDTFVRTIKRTFGEAHVTDGYLAIQPIEIPCRVRKRIVPSYSIKNIRDIFGANGKILINRKAIFSASEFWLSFTDDVKDALEKMQTQGRKRILNKVVSSIKQLPGNADFIRKKIEEKGILNDIKADIYYKLIIDKLYPNFEHEYDKFDFFYQLNQLYINNWSEIRDAIAYSVYENTKRMFSENITAVNTTWDNTIIPKESKSGKLRVEFPLADQISNGQRDVLTFTVHLMAFLASMRKNRKYLLLIDEVFDYLDDANMVAAQYYLSQILKQAKETEGVDLTIGIFTHLNPNHFRSYVFNQRLLNVIYLGKVKPCSSANMKAFISMRQRLNRGNAKQNDLYEKMSNYYFHYNPALIDLQETAKEYIPRNDFKTSWLKDDNFLKHILGELNKYLSNNEDYDPYAVCMAIRIGLEKRLYDTLNEVQKDEFIKIKITKDKISYAEREHISIPENIQMLSVIFNEAAHLYTDNNLEVQEKPIVYKLNHPVIKHIVEYLFDYTGENLTLNNLH